MGHLVIVGQKWVRVLAALSVVAGVSFPYNLYASSSEIPTDVVKLVDSFLAERCPPFQEIYTQTSSFEYATAFGMVDKIYSVMKRVKFYPRIIRPVEGYVIVRVVSVWSGDTYVFDAFGEQCDFTNLREY